MARLIGIIFSFLAMSAIGASEKWSEEILKTLSVQEKIGQLFVVPACPRYEKESLLEVIRNCHIGAVLIKQAHPSEQVPFMNTLQESSKLPLLCLGDAEWGLAMRMDDTLAFPKNLTLGAIQEERLLYEFGKVLGKQCKHVGIHLNLAPVVDVNNNPNNPIIGMRSFGDHPDNVGRKGALVIRGMQKEGVLACAKHFPGHGDVTIDSHHDLPMIPHRWEHLNETEFVPFKAALLADVQSVMSGHLYLEELDSVAPASLSYPIMSGLLKKEWGFEGLVITDALNMKALSNHYEPGEIAVCAFLAGHDLLLYGAHRYNDVEVILKEIIPVAFAAIEKGVAEGRISEERLDESVLKILKAKESLGLERERLLPISPDLMEQLHSSEAVALQKALFQASVTLVNCQKILPLPLEEIEYVRLWEEESSLRDSFKSQMSSQEHLCAPLFPHQKTVVLGVNHVDQIPYVHEICQSHSNVLIALFISPYHLHELPNVPIVLGYEWCAASEEAVWNVITGKEKGTGKLPIAASQ